MDNIKDNERRFDITVFSGGTGGNSLVDLFNKIIERRRCHLHYVIPISDNGGSSSELIRFVGGPSVGDIRSRLVRLIPNPGGDEERTAIKSLFEYRLCADPVKARSEWLDVVEGRHLLWTFVSSPKRELIRSVFNTVNLELVKRARPSSVFNFGEASIGNLFLTGARIFSGSFESAIYLLSMICEIPSSVSVLPAINSNFTHHIAVGLADGTQIVGQVAISHPSARTSLPDEATSSSRTPHRRAPPTRGGFLNPRPHLEDGTGGEEVETEAELQSSHVLLTDVDDDSGTETDHDRVEDASLPGSLPALRRRHVGFSKEDDEALPARIERLWYINPYGHEIRPVANPKALAAIERSGTVVYSVGSLYTSILPSVVLRGVGRAVAEPGVRHRVLILNSRLDRETGGGRGGATPMTARDFVMAIARAGAESWMPGKRPWEEDEQGVLRRFVTHLVYLEGAGEGAPRVDVDELRRLGIECVPVRGKRDSRGSLRYDEEDLGRALEAIIDS
ncbi:hypothetical protein VTK73DRAFT_336 [Phialemonium thermophilum]|uniref:Uncharacterized protein n=1 Tax=Phialemonium thermophilum TaxID=223376 RepID=A0ABR3XFI3_9PEZI